MNEIYTAISTVGFPIVAYGAMFWYMMQQDKAHQEEIKNLSEAVNNNTLVVQKLLDKMEGDGKNE